MFCDNRKVCTTLCDGRVLKIDPDFICDFTALPFKDKQFKQVVFDPPHLVKAGKNSFLALKYGLLDNNWQPIIKAGFNECYRVLDDWGSLIFKWSQVQIKVSDIIKAIGREPDFGHKSGRLNNTHWLSFLKIPKLQKQDESTYSPKGKYRLWELSDKDLIMLEKMLIKEKKKRRQKPPPKN
jgi:hypothetical protein